LKSRIQRQTKNAVDLNLIFSVNYLYLLCDYRIARSIVTLEVVKLFSALHSFWKTSMKKKEHILNYWRQMDTT